MDSDTLFTGSVKRPVNPQLPGAGKLVVGVYGDAHPSKRRLNDELDDHAHR
ncbi:Uncharacterised protein [Mycobacteroides abscessus]|nr:Uncharacterised protein [Mycobacteroides abscessus]